LERACKGVDAIETYFIATTKAIVSCTFDITDVSILEGNYEGNDYFRYDPMSFLGVVKHYPDLVTSTANFIPSFCEAVWIGW
jgi:hypothetical protein